MAAIEDTAGAKPGFLREVRETAGTLGAGLAIALALRVVVFQPYTIPSSSMEPGLVTGDYIVVSKWPYGWSRASIPFNPPLPGGPGSILPKTRCFNPCCGVRWSSR